MDRVVSVALMGKSDEFINSKFRANEEEQEQAEVLCGILNTAREATGKLFPI